VTILEVESERGNGLVRIALKGELDLSTAAKVETELRRAEESSEPLLVLDLGGLTFLDSTGLRTIVAADRRAREVGRRFAIVRGPGPVQRVFTVTKLDERLDMVDDLSAVMRHEA
jgi:anti-anti-sigma factor